MFGPEILTDTVTEWLLSLDYEYMLLHITMCYGLYYSENLKWISKRLGGLTSSIWWVGAMLGLIEILRFLPFFHGDGFDVQKVISIFHSFLIIQVFVSDIVKVVHRWVGVIAKAANKKP